MSDMIARGMAANAMSSGGGGGGGTTVDAYSKNETDNLLRGKANASDVYTSQQTDDLLDDKVNKVSGKGLSTNDYTNEDMSLVKTISNKANTNDVNASITNLQNQISETSENVDTINTELMTNAGYSLGMSINPTTFELTMTLKNSTGGTVSSQKVDLPIESMVVDASYANGNLNLTLQNGTSLSVDISSIVSGLVKDTFKIAGIDMKDNIEANELRAALGVYTTTEVDNKLGQKANASTTYSKTEVDNKVSAINTNVQANTTAINATNERVTQNESDILKAENEIARVETSLQNQIDEIVLEASGSGDVTAEVAQARTDYNGVAHATLKARLDVVDVSINNLNTNIISENVKFDVYYEEGALNINTGGNADGSDKARSEYIEFNSNTRIEFDSIVKILLLFYDENKGYLGRSGTAWITESPVENLTSYYANAKYCRVVVVKNNMPTYNVPNLVSIYGTLPLKIFAGNINKNLSNKNMLEGKKIIVMGDSISDASLTTQATKRYFDLLAENDGMVILQDGWSGTGYVREYGGHGTIVSRINSFTYEAPDYISIFAGTNDWYGDAGEGKCELGTFGDDYESGSFYGVLDHTYNTLVTKYPSTSVIIALPIHRAWETSPNQRGNTLEEYVEAIRKVAHKYSFVVVDLYNEGGINPLIPASRTEYFTTLDNVLDGTHPNNEGHKKIYPKFREALVKA